MSAWAKFPTAWVKAPIEGAGGSPPTFPLAELKWSGHRVSAIAALVILISLAVRLNLSRRGRELDGDPGDRVQMTYTEIEEQTGYARPTISKAISLLEALGAIRATKTGRVNVYQLIGVDQRGGWCQLPQGHLADGSAADLKRLVGIHNNRLTLEALKLYVLLLTFRNQQLNTTSISYPAIIKYTGMRREDVPKAAGMLVALDLIGVSEERDYRSEEDRSKRYTVKGLKAF